MKVDMQNFRPLTMFNQFAKGSVKIDVGSTVHSDNHIDKKNIATNIVNSRLNEALGLKTQAESNDADVFDFESVGKNILSFVTDAISHAKDNGASKSELKEMLADAKKGIKEGLKDASKELKESGLLSDEIKHGIKETNHFLKDGLKTFADDLFKKSDNSLTGLTSYSEASHYNLTKDASFSFTTKDGDEVNITFNSDYLQQSASVLKLTDNSLDYASSQKNSFQGAFSFEVNGELNEDEQQAINKLMGNLQNVSDLFFDGNLEDAFEKAQDISLDPTHLAAFSMDLTRTETMVSIKEYQQVMPGKELAEQFVPINSELTDAYEQAKPFAIEDHLSDLLGWLMPEQEGANKLLEYSQAVFEQLHKLDAMSPSESDV
ncbi:MAG: hypothetical protein GY787_14480 [Alteromonadales bacterium]|nr:hypothetical protein [Alteromonadales bacterium]